MGPNGVEPITSEEIESICKAVEEERAEEEKKKKVVITSQ